MAHLHYCYLFPRQLHRGSLLYTDENYRALMKPISPWNWIYYSATLSRSPPRTATFLPDYPAAIPRDHSAQSFPVYISFIPRVSVRLWDEFVSPIFLRLSLAAIVINVKTDLALLARRAETINAQCRAINIPPAFPFAITKAGHNFLRIMNVSGYLRLRRYGAPCPGNIYIYNSAEKPRRERKIDFALSSVTSL